MPEDIEQPRPRKSDGENAVIKKHSFDSGGSWVHVYESTILSSLYF